MSNVSEASDQTLPHARDTLSDNESIPVSGMEKASSLEDGEIEDGEVADSPR